MKTLTDEKCEHCGQPIRRIRYLEVIPRWIHVGGKRDGLMHCYSQAPSMIATPKRRKSR